MIRRGQGAHNNDTGGAVARAQTEVPGSMARRPRGDRDRGRAWGAGQMDHVGRFSGAGCCPLGRSEVSGSRQTIGGIRCPLLASDELRVAPGRGPQHCHDV
ncbi:hypothetical protein NDU88_001652 [Pleurodeles waltl]|uniref:Uncharacterized protein n=1 Tax=Pleurodeles waltl TaxID=8319 RepID=A0AAV7U721_PLEWA|nr:hypothetical protein NDU88_001652 [Pleurodeles waltl]